MKTWRASLVILTMMTAVCSQEAAPVMQAQALRVQPRPMRPLPNLTCVLCSLTVSAAPTAVNFTLVKSGQALGSTAVTIKTTLVGVSLLGSLSLYGYFSSSATALTDGRATPNRIPTYAVLGTVPTGSPTTYTAFTQTTPLGPAGAGLLLYTTSSVLSLGCLPIGASCRTDNLSLKIDLSNPALAQLPAGTYTGTLTLQAQAL